MILVGFEDQEGLEDLNVLKSIKKGFDLNYVPKKNLNNVNSDAITKKPLNAKKKINFQYWAH